MRLFIDEIGCEPSQTELDFRAGGTKSCQDLQDLYNVCTNEASSHHEIALCNCPVTCKIAIGECPGNLIFSVFIFTVSLTTFKL